MNSFNGQNFRITSKMCMTICILQELFISQINVVIGVCVCQAEEDLGRAQKVFEEISYELMEELPSLWNRCHMIYLILELFMSFLLKR